jgi:hypothetical protein
MYEVVVIVRGTDNWPSVLRTGNAYEIVLVSRGITTTSSISNSTSYLSLHELDGLRPKLSLPSGAVETANRTKDV